MGARVGVFVWLVSGLALAGCVGLGVGTWCGLTVGAGAVAALAALRIRVLGRAPTLVPALLLAGGLAVLATGVVSWRLAPLVDGPVAAVVGSRAVVEAELVVTSDPERRLGRTSGSRRTDDQWQLDADALRISVPGRGGGEVDVPVRVLTTEDVEGVLPGTRLLLRARVLSADPLHGRAATLVAEAVQVTAEAPPLQDAAGRVRAGLRAAVSARPGDQAGLLPGLVVGDTSAVTADLDSAMRDSGLAHLTAVSGGNVAVVVVLVLALSRLVGLRRGFLQVGVVGLAVACYVVVARPQPSVVRAAAMTAVVLAAIVVDARIRPLDALGWSVSGLVLLDPFLALSLGFAMSVAATAALVLLAARWAGPSEGLRGWRRIGRLLLGLVVVSAAAQAAVAPLVVGIGGGIPVGGVVANLLAAPAVAPATALGLVAALVAVASPALAALVAQPACWAVGWIAVVARVTSDRFGVLPWPDGWGGGVVLALVLVLGGVGLVVARRAGGVVTRAALAVCAAGGLLALAPPASVPGAAAWPPAGWRIVMCDVGQGDSVVLAAGPGSAIVVDAGPDPATVDRCLRRLGVRRVALLVLTHFHADHVEGVPGVLRGRSVGPVLVSPLPEPEGEQRRVRAWTHDAGVSVRVAAPGDVWTVGAVTLRVVWPRRILRGQGSDPNNASVAITADIDGVTVLLPGDLEPAAQDALVASGELGPVDVVKVPHHGSSHQAASLLEVTRPRVALVGVGADNDYGHPAAVTLNAYRVAGAVIGRTDLDGDLAVLLDDAGALGVVRRGH
jgi:competence protein ComEC